MRYASIGGGKRVRPFLVAASAALFDVPRERALMVGAALECVHCYSLVHDDLPAMDDDDLRRGGRRRTKKFDEATAILAGDGLLTFAFDILARNEVHPEPAVRVELVLRWRAPPDRRMVGGQMLDLAAEGRFGDGKPLALDEAAVMTLQAYEGRRAAAASAASRRHPGAARPPERAALGALRRDRRPGLSDRRRPARRGGR